MLGLSPDAQIQVLVMAAAKEPLLQEAKLAELALSVGDDMVDTMLGMIPEEAELAVASIRAALGAGDLAEMRRWAHSLKGLASNFGALRITAFARALELEADAAGAGLLLAHLVRAVADTTALIAAR